MNGKAAKGIRRDIRRAVGADALDVVNQQSHVLNKAVPEIGRLRERVKALEDASALDEIDRQIASALANDINSVKLSLLSLPVDVVTRWGRLRWLLGF